MLAFCTHANVVLGNFCLPVFMCRQHCDVSDHLPQTVILCKEHVHIHGINIKYNGV